MSSTFPNSTGRLLLHVRRQRGWVCLKVMQSCVTADLLTGVRSSVPGGESPLAQQAQGPSQQLRGESTWTISSVHLHRQHTSMGAAPGRNKMTPHHLPGCDMEGLSTASRRTFS